MWMDNERSCALGARNTRKTEKCGARNVGGLILFLYDSVQGYQSVPKRPICTNLYKPSWANGVRDRDTVIWLETEIWLWIRPANMDQIWIRPTEIRPWDSGKFGILTQGLRLDCETVRPWYRSVGEVVYFLSNSYPSGNVQWYVRLWLAGRIFYIEGYAFDQEIIMCSRNEPSI